MLLFSIGHSNRTLDQFVGLLRESDITLLADVRSYPMSRRNPQFNREALEVTLPSLGISYEWLRALGGRRKAEKGCCSPNGLWQHDSFRSYADYALTEAFPPALAALCEMGRRFRCAFMCSEAVWWRCHRRIITDYLLAAGVRVQHILGPGQITDATMTGGAEPKPNGTILYPPAQPALL